ncbi:hypothetical protein HY442_00515 [Candidatus Parcubacteria bacterium]|nr:hypothetical protein [Candidatus Parcubacteria bacterium]MBI4385356.1 hypothetical protein [Candidatus Parcubacteria bacterium]
MVWDDVTPQRGGRLFDRYWTELKALERKLARPSGATPVRVAHRRRRFEDLQEYLIPCLVRSESLPKRRRASFPATYREAPA